jgi:deoxyribonuclease-2
MTALIYLVHSIPHYPPKPSTKSYGLSSSQMRYGQSMICLSIPLAELEKVGKQLLFAWPQIIDKFVPSSLQTNSFLQNLISVANGSKYTKPKQGY